MTLPRPLPSTATRRRRSRMIRPRLRRRRPRVRTRRLHIDHEQPILAARGLRRAHHIPRRHILAHDIPALRVAIPPRGIFRSPVPVLAVPAVHRRTAHLPRRLPDQLRKVARLLGEARRFRKVVVPHFVAPGGDRGRGVGVAEGEVLAVRTVLSSLLVRDKGYGGRGEGRAHRVLPFALLGPVAGVRGQGFVPE